MRITTSIAATAVAVLALTLTGCGGDDGDGKSALPAKDDTGTSQSEKTGKPSPSGTNASGDMKSSSPTPTPSRTPAKSTPVPSRTTTSAPTKAPVPSRTSAAPPTTPSKLASVQGNWYYPVRDASGNVITLRISGTSMSASGNKGTCSGTINASMAVTFSCQGETTNGTAQLSNGGQTITFNWSSGNPDRFVRTKPA
ncbi:hypothetical protein ACFV2X_30610 [Streptomyces sp. NPDC059679]|uniref:hypothetical protein n=1 Tax=Streptomyces sp. NPDC059679 TaxID=3346903 RepID=UPI0036B0DE52